MIFWILNCLLVFAICMLCAGILIPQILLIAFRRNLFDEVDERKIHHGTVPRLGGIAFVPVIFFSTILLCGIHIAMGNESFIDLFASNARALCFAVCCLLVLYLVGIADDLIGIRYSAKFVAQILCSVMLIAGGLTINNLHGILGIYILPDWISWLLTVLFVVFIINAINLIDGVDGLASGLSSVALLFYGYFFVLEERYIFAMLSFAAIGVLLPFFYYNVFGRAERRRKIFMGDTGSLTIGFLLCFLGIRLITCIPDDEGLPNPLLIMLSPLAIPSLDVLRVFIHRKRLHKNPFMPDKSHIHHKLLAAGMVQRGVMLVIVFGTVVLTFLNIFISRYIEVTILALIDIVLWTVFNIWLTSRIKRSGSDLAKSWTSSN